jgi:hypothetical protein
MEKSVYGAVVGGLRIGVTVIVIVFVIGLAEMSDSVSIRVEYRY